MTGNAKGPHFNEEELSRLDRARRATHTIVTSRPQSLGYLSIACIIINRMVGQFFSPPLTQALRTPLTQTDPYSWGFT
jgi:hypothetical protein